MDERLENRHMVLVEGVSKREILWQKKMHRRTLEKILRDSVCPGYPDKVDAICCQLEHVSAKPVQIFVTFRNNTLGRLEFDKPIILSPQ